jgi:plasmid stabilization system protein ParE
MKVVFSKQAQVDLVAIGDWIRRENPVRADSFVQELLDACESLADFPERFPYWPRPKRRPLRHRAYGNYLILYEVGESCVTITAIVHGARDVDALLD